MFGKIHTVSAKSRSIDDLASSLDIGTLEILNDILVVNDPGLGTDAARHAARHQIGTCSPIQNKDIFGQFTEFFFCHEFVASLMKNKMYKQLTWQAPHFRRKVLISVFYYSMGCFECRDAVTFYR